MFHIGIVEDNLDPLKLGRLRVRIFGIHTQNRKSGDAVEYLPTSDLPWAFPAMPISNSSIDGISDFTGLVKGTRVLVFFLDNEGQRPFYFATIPFNLTELPDFTDGFSDPSSTHPSSDYIDESSISRLARNESIEETCVETKNNSLTEWSVLGVDIAEPESGYDAEYPHNRVIEMPSGIVVELDSTPSAERIHIYHPEGTFTEIQADGSRINKTKGNQFDITLEDKHVYVGGDLTVKVVGNAMIEVDGDALVTCNGSADLELGDDSTITALGDLLIDGSGDTTIYGATKVEINSAVEAVVKSDVKVTVDAPLIEIDAGAGFVNVTGAMISLN
jgi:hypothetical protein